MANTPIYSKIATYTSTKIKNTYNNLYTICEHIYMYLENLLSSMYESENDSIDYETFLRIGGGKKTKRRHRKRK
jgi:hypothetical protein